MDGDIMYKDKKVFILGMARSGYEVAKLLRKYTDKILITDCKPQNEEHVKELQALGIQYVLTDKPEEILDDSFEIMVKNPGVNYRKPCVQKAKKLKIPVVNEVEVTYNLLPENVKIIAITG